MTDENKIVGGYSEFRSKISGSTLSNEYNFKWYVESFSQLPFGIKLISPEFSPAPGCKWSGKMELDNSSIFLSIITLPSEPDEFQERDVDVHFKTSFSDINGIAFCVESEKELIKINSSCEKTVLIGSVMSEDYERAFKLEDDILVIQTLIKIYDFNIQTAVTDLQISTGFRNEPIQNLLDDIKKMYEYRTNTDVILRVEEEELAAHEAVLRARSRLFERELVTEGNTIKIEGISASAMSEFLNFMYTGIQIEYDYKTAYELYCAAVKYEVSDLRKICAYVFLKELTVDNICEVLVLADRHNDEFLKKIARGFAVDNFRDIVSSGKWKEFICDETAQISEIVSLGSEIKSKQ